MKQYLPINLDHPNQAKKESWVSRRDSMWDSYGNTEDSCQVTASFLRWPLQMSRVNLVQCYGPIDQSRHHHL